MATSASSACRRSRPGRRGEVAHFIGRDLLLPGELFDAACQIGAAEGQLAARRIRKQAHDWLRALGFGRSVGHDAADLDPALEQAFERQVGERAGHAPKNDFDIYADLVLPFGVPCGPLYTLTKVQTAIIC